jgi:hypothetical protein
MFPARAALSEFSVVIIAGESSGSGKSFIELCRKPKPELPICNLSRLSPDILEIKLNLRQIARDLSP